MQLSKEEKERFLRAVEEDKEFRYALMGLLGYKEILDAIIDLKKSFQRLEERQIRLEERQTKLEERQARLEEMQVKLEERQSRLEELFSRLEERQARLEERQARLEEMFHKLEERMTRLEERQTKLEELFSRMEERQARLEERQARLEEMQAKLEERMARLEREMVNTRRYLNTVLYRFGILSESGFREAMRYVIQDLFGVAKVDRWIYRDEEGFVYGYPSIVEADVVVRDGTHILIELKSRVAKMDVSEIWRIGRLYEKVTGIKPKLVVVGGDIDPDARELAEKLGVEVKPVVVEE